MSPTRPGTQIARKSECKYKAGCAIMFNALPAGIETGLGTRRVRVLGPGLGNEDASFPGRTSGQEI